MSQTPEELVTAARVRRRSPLGSALALLLVACAPTRTDTGATPAPDDDSTAADDDTGDDDTIPTFCDVGPTGELTLCTFDESFPWNTDLLGRFTEWGEGFATFELEDGTLWSLEMSSSGVVLDDVPDPRVMDWVRIRLDGTCNRGGASFVLRLALADDADAVFLLLGNTMLWEGDGLRIESARNIEACAATDEPWCSCAERCYVKQVAFTTEGGQGWGVLQGERLDDGPLHFAAWTAHSRDAILCADVAEDLQSWALWVDVPVPAGPAGIRASEGTHGGLPRVE